MLFRSTSLAFLGVLICSGVAAQETPPPSEPTFAETADVAAAVEPPPIQVTVRGQSRVARVESGAQAVVAVDLADARERSADAAEVLARTAGVTVQRSGALGSRANIGIHGLSGHHVQSFVDGVPLDFTAFVFGVGNAPVELFDRIETHRGVVPLRLGADALGGAVELISPGVRSGSHGALSYNVGSFDTHRLSLAASHKDRDSGLYARIRGFGDVTDNDYRMDVKSVNAAGQSIDANVHRMHDGYRALGAMLDLGVANQPWARQLELRSTLADYAKEVPHNLLTTVAYGEVTFDKRSIATQLRHAHDYGDDWSSEVILGHAYTRTTFSDRGTCRYGWDGTCLAPLPRGGEIRGQALDRAIHDHSIFARAHLQWTLHPEHTLRLTLAPTFTRRHGRDAALSNGAIDPINEPRHVTRTVGGIEHTWQGFDDRLENIAFLKGYWQRAHADERLANGTIQDAGASATRFGFGNAARWRFTDALSAKLSYELATRMPEPAELFGDGVLTVNNLGLTPESSHNINATLRVDARDTLVGNVDLSATAFARLSHDMIVLLTNDSYAQHFNVLDARTLGVEGRAGWALESGLLGASVNATYQDQRNTSDAGAFADRRGDRLPNRPYLFGTLSVESRIPHAFQDDDEVVLAWVSRYTHAFYPGWESLGAPGDKLTVESQVSHALSFGYRVNGPRTLALFVELHNLTNARLFDVYGIPRPGRAAYAKFSVAL